MVSRNKDATVKQMKVGLLVMEIKTLAADCDCVCPRNDHAWQTLLNLDQIGRTLDPDFDPNASIRRNAGAIMQTHMMQSLSPGNLLSRVMEMRNLAQALPGRVNKIMDAVANNEMEIAVHAIDETKLMAGFQKVANRITVGLILAALIIGEALLMRVETSFRILGYPGLAIIFFALAVAGGVALVFNILFMDESSPPKSPS